MWLFVIFSSYDCFSSIRQYITSSLIFTKLLPYFHAMSKICFYFIWSTVRVVFVRASGERLTASGKVGDNLLDVVVNNNIDLDGYGACEGTLTCSTCHLIFSKPDYNKLPSKPSDEEMDMLDLAYDLCDTSRLGCQVILTQEMDGLEVNVPATINDARS